MSDTDSVGMPPGGEGVDEARRRMWARRGGGKEDVDEAAKTRQ